MRECRRISLRVLRAVITQRRHSHPAAFLRTLKRLPRTLICILATKRFPTRGPSSRHFLHLTFAVCSQLMLNLLAFRVQMSFAVTLGGPATEQLDPLAGSGPF